MNADKLFDILQEEYAIPDDYFTNLIRSMRNRVNIVVQNKGRSTKYWNKLKIVVFHKILSDIRIGSHWSRIVLQNILE